MKVVESDSKTYLMVLPVGYYRISEQVVAMESAFAEHLRLLKAQISPLFSQFVIGMVELDIAGYEKKKHGLAIINPLEAGMTFSSLYREQDLSSRVKQPLQLLKVADRLKNLVSDCDLLHTGLSANIWFPMEFIATVWGILLRKKIVYVVDIDFRNSAQMNYRTGRWSLKSYLLCKYIYDKFRSFQVNVAVEKCSLILLKGEKLCRDFGRGKPRVRNFLDAAHSERHVINSEALNRKLLQLRDHSHPLDIVYFGRLTSYKGVDFCIQAVAIAQRQMGCNIRFHVVGDGEQAEELKTLARKLDIAERVIFYGAIPFSRDFFKQLYGYHLLLATPLREDTPRSALDAMAAGIPILAFDTYYYRDLTSTGAVDTVRWLSVEQLAERIADYDNNRELLASMVMPAVDFAKRNTQEKWLEQRFQWTLTYSELQP
jgi:glycosyltransferase involved in cell wall biosynthesis